jgi:predicted nucleotidyltransferase
MSKRPQWWIERAATRQNALAVAVERLRARLGLYRGVRGALVFGSYARGEVGPESDLDLIVVRDTDLAQMQRDDDIRASLDLGVPYDLVTLTPEQYERLPRERSFYEQAVREGLWIDATRPG